MVKNTIKRILTAPVYDVAVTSPLDKAAHLSGRYGGAVWLKREDLQPVFSFKLRGAYAKIAALDETARARGVIAASAGNHAQGVALAARTLRIKAVIVMPVTTPEIKVKAVQALGGAVVLHGDAFDEAYAHAREIEAEKGLTFVHPYDDLDVIAGQGTIGVEIMRQHTGPIDAVFLPVGGGGLIAGVSAYIKFVRPETKIIGVEPEDSDCLYQALAAGRRVQLPQVGLFADGVAVRQIGEQTFRIARRTVDEVIRVSTDEICAAIKDIFNETRSVAEPSGALSVAGLKKYLDRDPDGPKGRSLVAVISGANINFERLRHVTERTSIGEKREILLAVTLPEKPGALRAFCVQLGKRGITGLNYRCTGQDEAHILVGIQVQDAEAERQPLIRRLEDHGFPATDMTDNDLAKEHIRRMVGGGSGAPGLTDEVLYRFEFPERPGALLRFLTAMNHSWSITLFHYRNHGAAFGRVLMGLRVPETERKALKSFIDDLGYVAVNETANPAYRLFLQNPDEH